MSFKFSKTLVIFVQTVHFVTPFLCNETQDYWCRRSGLGLKYQALDFSYHYQTEYAACIHYCYGNNICKGFEYNEDRKNCRFAATLLKNVEKGTKELFWKKSVNSSCADEMAEETETESSTQVTESVTPKQEICPSHSIKLDAGCFYSPGNVAMTMDEAEDSVWCHKLPDGLYDLAVFTNTDVSLLE